MSVLSKDANLVVRWSTAERIQALKRIVPRASIAKALRATGCGHVIAVDSPVGLWFGS